MAITPEIEPKIQPDVGSEKQQELTPRLEVPQTPQNLHGFVKPVVVQPQTVTDDQGNTVLTPAQQVFASTMTQQEYKEAQKAPAGQGRHWLAVFMQRLIKMGIKIIFPTYGWSRHPSQQQAA